MRETGADEGMAGQQGRIGALGQGSGARAWPPRGAQRGAVAIMFATTLIVMLGFCALALDLARLYNRKVELQSVADAAALAAAKELDGTAAGVAKAIDRAADAAERLMYQYNREPIVWSDAAISFSASPAPESGWVNAGAAAASPDGLLFVKVDTSGLDPAYGTADTLFMQVVTTRHTMNATGRAIAGRSSINVTPLAICAMSADPGSARVNPGVGNVELVEYGFRRGVSYDLMRLNPNGTNPENFVISPIDPPGPKEGPAVHTTPPMVGPFICTGTMAMTRVTGGKVTVRRPFPLGALYQHFNTRFGQYAGTDCTPAAAPPDSNVKPYHYNSIGWMNPAPGGQSAQVTTVRGRLETVADLPPGAPGASASMYGPLWSFAKAARFISYVPGAAEPESGYMTFLPTNWSSLYSPGNPAATSGYPATTPYLASSGANYQAPSSDHKPGLRSRRLLHLPLLSCPVPAGATERTDVLAIGRFFMTVPATPTSLSAEFAGVVPEQSLKGRVELYP